MSFYLVYKYWRRHRKSLAALLFSGVLLSAVVFCAFLKIRQDNRRQLEQFYDYHGLYTVAIPTPDRLDPAIELLSTDETISGKMYVTGLAGIGQDRYQIGTIDDPHGLAHLPMEAGRMPENENEIAIDRGVLDKFGFFGGVGDEIELDVGTYKLVGIIGSDYGLGREGSMLHEQRMHENDTYYTTELAPTKYFPLLFTGGDGSKDALYTWVMLDNTLGFDTKDIFSPCDEVAEYLRQNGIEDTGIAGNSYWFFDLYNNKPAEAKMMLLGYNNVSISSDTRVMLILAGAALIIAVLSVIATLKNVFAERENTMILLNRTGFSKRQRIKMYFTEMCLLTAAQTLLGAAAGALAHIAITRAEVRFLEKRDVLGFTLDPLITDNSIDPFLAMGVVSVAVMAAGYMLASLLNKAKARGRRRRKARPLYFCISRIFADRSVTVIQTLALTFIAFGTVFGYLCYHNLTGRYDEDDEGNATFHPYIDTKVGSNYQFDLEEDGIEEYYYAPAGNIAGIGSYTFAKEGVSAGIDDSTARSLENCYITGLLTQTFILGEDKYALKWEITSGSDDERKFMRDNSSFDGKKLFEEGTRLYRVKTKLADEKTIEGLDEYITEGRIDTDKLNSGEEIILILRSGEAPIRAGESFTAGSATTENGFGADKVTLKKVKVGAVVFIPTQCEKVRKYAVAASDDYSLLTTVTGAKSIGLHGAMYSEIFAYEEIGGKLPLGTGLELISLKKQKKDMFINTATQYLSMWLLIMLMSLLGFAAYFNGIGMKIRMKEYEISIMRAVGAPKRRIRRRLMLDSIRIPILAAGFAYTITRIMQRAMLAAHIKCGEYRETGRIWFEKAFDNGDDPKAEEWLEEFQRWQDKEYLLHERFLLGRQMWYVDTEKVILIILAVMTVITVIITWASFGRFKNDISYRLSKGRKRQ